MFLFSISKIPLAIKIAGSTRHEWSRGAFAATNWSVTAYSDGLLGEVELEGDCFALREAAPRSGPGPRLELVAIQLRADALVANIKRVSNSGRAVYHHVLPDGGLLIASHLRLLQAAGARLIEVPALLPEVYLYRQVCPPRTLVQDVGQLAAGDGAEVTIEKGKWSVRRVPAFMPPPANPAYSGGENDPALVGMMRTAIENAVLRTGISGDKIGCLLSGGLDSSVITRVVKSERGVGRTFSCVYPFEDVSSDTEFRYATTAAQALGTRHDVHIPTMSDYLHGALDAIAIAEEPTMHLQTVLIHVLCKDVLAPRGYTVVPCGEGADGMFGGRLQRLLTAFNANPLKKRALELPGVSSALKEISRRTNRWGMIADLADKRWSPTTPFSDPRHILWTLAVFGDRQWIANHLNCTPAQMIGERPKVMIPYLGRDLRDCTSILALLSESSETQVIWSKIGEAHGMCFTYPFLDSEVSNLSYSIPWEQKLAGPKPMLRAVARTMQIPEAIVARPKASFDIDPHKWGFRGGVFEPLISLSLPVIDEAAIRSLQSTYVFKAHTLWTVINYALWKRLFILNEPLEKLHAELDASMERLGVFESYRAPGRVLGGSSGTRSGFSRNLKLVS